MINENNDEKTKPRLRILTPINSKPKSSLVPRFNGSNPQKEKPFTASLNKLFNEQNKVSSIPNGNSKVEPETNQIPTIEPISTRKSPVEIIAEPQIIDSQPSNTSVHLMEAGTHQIYDIASEIPRGRGFQVAQWSNAEPVITQVNGSVSKHISHLGWHLHGLNIIIGSTSSGADKTPMIDATGTVHGAIPRALKAIRSQAEAAILLNPNNTDEEGRPYQFASVLVLGREDHARIMRTLNDPSRSFQEIIGAAGIPTGTTVSGVLYDNRGILFGLTVEFPDPDFLIDGRAPKHFLFLHSTRAMGGGKSDEALCEGQLRFESRSLADEFQWWIAALELGNGVIGSIESTLGGTARTGRYALLTARIPKQLFAREAFEAIGVDDASWVKEYLQSDELAYRANFATTILRTVYGEFGRRLSGLKVEIADRSDILTRDIRNMKAQIAILRNINLGHPELELLKGDTSDEYWTEKREEGITESDWSTIYDPVEKSKSWKQQRRIRTSTAISLTESRIVKLAEGLGSGIAKDIVEQSVERMRGLATFSPNTLPAGGFVTITAYLHSDRINSISSKILNDSMETIAASFKSNGTSQVIINLAKMPRGLQKDSSQVLIHISEDQPCTNLLIVSTDSIDTHKQRPIMSDPALDSRNPKIYIRSAVSAYARLLGRMIDAHRESGHTACEQDGDVIHAYFRHWFEDFHRRPNTLIGGSNRKTRENNTKGGI